MLTPFETVTENVFVARDARLHLNVGLIVGSERALLVDSGAGPESAQRIWDEAREVTELPLVVVNTHAHFDHTFGNARLAALGVEEFWAHPGIAAALEREDAGERKAAVAVDPSAAEGGPDAQVLTPNRLVPVSESGAVKPTELDLGGVTASLFFLGRGHTDHDLLVGCGSVLFAGDLVEESGDPHFADAYPDEWIRTLGKITALEDLYETVIPGHGRPMGMDAVKVERATMRQAVRVTRTAMNEASTDMTKAVPILPYGPTQSRALLRRLRELAEWTWLEGYGRPSDAAGRA